VSDVEFERRVERALRAPVPTSARPKQAIMERVRQAALEGGGPTHRTLPFAMGRTTRHSIIGIALAAGIGSVTTLSSLAPATRSAGTQGVATSTVIGDSVVERLRDTLRLVQLIFDDPSARHVAVVGDFNGWRGDATHMRRDARTGRWAVTLALHDGEHRYAIVVDNTRWAGDVPAHLGDATQHVYSLLHIARASN
jgi:hypothetical protein